MIMKKIRYLILILIVGLVISCDELDTDGDGIIDSVDKEINTPIKYIGNVDASGKACIKNVYMLLDNTGSMNGYKVGSTDFTSAIGRLAGNTNGCKMSQEIQNVVYQNYGSDAITQELNFKEFIQLFTSSASKDGSNIVEHFKQLTSMVSDSSVGVYITDAVISLNGDNNKIASLCSAQLIPDCVKVLGKEDNGAIIIRCKSRFNGTYQSSASPKKSFYLNDPARPFFVFLFGKRSLLDFYIEKTIKNNPSFTNTVTDISFVNYTTTIPIEATIDMTTGSGSWALNLDKKNTINVYSDNPIDVPIGLDLSYITSINPNLALLKQNFVIQNGEALEFDTKEQFLNNNKGVDKSAYPNSTHIIKIKYNNTKDSSRIFLTTNQWYQSYSTSDDSSIESIMPKIGSRKTFELDKIISSIFDASTVSRNNPNLHIATINFENNKN